MKRVIALLMLFGFLVLPCDAFAQADAHRDETLVLVPRGESLHLGQRLIRYGLTLDGLPVFFGGIAVQRDEGGRTLRVASSAPDPRATPPTHPRPTESQALDWALARGYGDARVFGAGWIDSPPHGVRPVVRVDVEESPGGEPLALFIDASNGAVVFAEPLVWTADPLAAVFPENPATTPDVEIVRLAHLEEGAERLTGKYAHVGTCVDRERCKEVTQLALRQDVDGGSFIYRPALEEFSFEDPFAEVNVYHNITSINAWARETYGWEGLFGEEPWIDVRVGRAWYNAAYYPATKEREAFLVFGQDIVDFAYDADVAFHEFGHGINRTLWDHPWMVRDELGIDVSMFGIEEALADIWAQQFAGDPVMDSYVWGSRTAHNSLTCPEDVRAEGHLEARILSGLGWDIREQIGPEAWGHTFFRALHFLTNDTGFDDFVEVLAESAAGLAEEGVAGLEDEHAETIRELGAARGLYDKACLDRIVPLREGTPRRVYGYGSKRTGKRHYPYGLQWVVEAPPWAAAFQLHFNWRYPLEDDDGEEIPPGYVVHLRRKEPVEVSWRDLDSLEEGEAAFDVVADETRRGAPMTVDFPLFGDEPLTPGEEVYVLLSSASEESIAVIDSAVYFLGQTPLPEDAGPPGSGGGASTPAAGDGSPTCAAVPRRSARYPIIRLLESLL